MYRSQRFNQISGTGSQIQEFFLFFPALLRNDFDTSEILGWDLYLLLRRIFNQVCSPRVELDKLDNLQQIIEQFLIGFRTTFPLSTTTYKMHYLMHYCDVMRHFGPLWRFNSLRFERLHQEFKENIKTSKNRKNVGFSSINYASMRYLKTFEKYKNPFDNQKSKKFETNAFEIEQIARKLNKNVDEIVVHSIKNYDYKLLKLEPGQIYMKSFMN